MRTFELIFSVVAALYGLLHLYQAVRHNGDFDAYLFSVLFVMLGIVMFWRAYSRWQR
jgi:hypothetical protein